jgi:hypothetical protein
MQYKTMDPDTVAAATDEPASGIESPPDTGGRLPSFLDEIASGMQTAVDRERERIATETSDSLDAHVERIRERASTEAEELKRLAEEDVRQIRESAAAESERLGRETETRIAERRDDLERHLRQHSELVEREISGTRSAVEEYQTELVRFVGRLSDERDPEEIARLARSLPEPPHVEAIASAARAEAIAELSRSEAATERAPDGSDLVGVMDPGITRPPADGSAAASEPALATDVTSEAAPAGDEQPAPIRGSRRWADRTWIIAAVLVVVVVVVGLVIAVATGQLQVAVSG